MTNQNVKNIKAIFQLASAAENADGIAWYGVAKSIAIVLADRYGVTTAQAVGVLAALSPRNKWSRNVVDAESLSVDHIAGPLIAR